MLKYNGIEYESTYFQYDTYDIIIRSKLPIDEFIEKIRNNEKVNCYMKVERECVYKFTEDIMKKYEINEAVNSHLYANYKLIKRDAKTCIKYAKDQKEMIKSILEKNNKDTMDDVLLYAYLEIANNYKDILSYNPTKNYDEELKLANNIEEYFNAHKDKYKEIENADDCDYFKYKKKFYLKHDDLLNVLADYYGIMPGHINHNEYSVNELKTMSDMAEDYWDYDRPIRSSYQPTFSFVENYSKMNPLEREVFDNSGVDLRIKSEILDLLIKNNRQFTSDIEKFLHWVNVRGPESPYTPTIRMQLKMYDLLNTNIDLSTDEYYADAIANFIRVEDYDNYNLSDEKKEWLFALMEKTSPKAMTYILNTIQYDDESYKFSKEFYDMTRQNMYKYSRDEETIDLQEYFKNVNTDTLTPLKSKLYNNIKDAFKNKYNFVPKVIDNIYFFARKEGYDTSTVVSAFERKKYITSC